MTLFPVDPAPPKGKGPSAGQRRTARDKALLAAGIHPATRQPLLGRHTCGECDHACNVHGGARRYWKCARHRLGPSRSEASDIRVSWPACTLFVERAP